MRVYRVRFDPDRYQSFFLDDRKIDIIKFLAFNGRPRKDTWTPPKVHVLFPMKEVPDFWMLEYSAAIAISAATFEKISACFTSSGELLPLIYQEQHFVVLNITMCVDALDKSRCTFFPGFPGPQTYAFLPEWIPTTLFKIPQTAVGEIYCAEWEGNPEYEFKAAVDHYQLKGLRFKLIWEG